MVAGAARLVAAERPDELAEAIAALAQDALARAELSAAGPRQAQAFSLDDTFAHYRSLWAGAPAPRQETPTMTTPSRDSAVRRPETPPIRNATP